MNRVDEVSFSLNGAVGGGGGGGGGGGDGDAKHHGPSASRPDTTSYLSSSLLLPHREL